MGVDPGRGVVTRTSDSGRDDPDPERPGTGTRRRRLWVGVTAAVLLVGGATAAIDWTGGDEDAGGSASRSSTARPSLPTGWPGPDNTGVPAGVRLTPYTGPCTISTPQTLKGIDARSCEAILVRSRDVVIVESLLPRVDTTEGDASVALVDSEVEAGTWVDGAVWGSNITLTRVEVTGASASVHCADNCEVTDSWLHEQFNTPGASFHLNAFISSGGSNILLRHNTMACTPQVNDTDGGCTADVSVFGDFAPMRKVTIDHNLFVANPTGVPWCLYAGYDPGKPYGSSPSDIVVTDNVFERGDTGHCGKFGAATSFLSRGNTWSGNAYDDGTPVLP
jgi:hypothetical protein